ncbi:MAG: SGNH/GDSL hydrolase family protein [Deltaproteobacteria bacterium]|nr:SGNH/GDSL hydrolase family protein [Deltaproteobacteria bacterium]MBI3388188.1 SGNH/GDSL hydrolase family protein [Deltaproteobacteria bacterium]
MRRTLLVIGLGATIALSAEAQASTINQNTSWTIDRAGTTTKYRAVGYGDSIFAGYRGSIFNVAKRAATLVNGEYASNAWGTDLEVIRRTKSGAVASDIYNNKIVAERSYMQNTTTRIVAFEMCGNDYLQARSNFNGQSGTCNYSQRDTALANCTNYMGLGMQAINQYATTATVKMIANLYYPGYNADNGLSNCTDPTTGQRVNKQDNFLPVLARSNWRACHLAETNGFACADSFAQYMGADYDSNGDGQIDSDALRYVSGESEDAYVTRISVTLRATIRDANTHFVNSSTSFDYIQSDDTHPTYSGSATIGINIFTGSGSGSGAPDYSGGQIVGGKNPVWNQFGHERMGWALSVFDPATP